MLKIYVRYSFSATFSLNHRVSKTMSKTDIISIVLDKIKKTNCQVLICFLSDQYKVYAVKRNSFIYISSPHAANLIDVARSSGSQT